MVARRLSFTLRAYGDTVRRWLVPMAVGVVGATISAVGISVPSVWYDEAATISAATRSLPELVALIGHIDAVHAVYYLAMHAVFGAVGYSPFSLRIGSALAVGIAAALVVVIDRQLRPGSLGLVAGLVFCVLPRVTWMGGEGRSFALATACAALLTALLLHALASSSGARWVLYGMAVLLACTVFLYLVLLVAAHGVTVLLLRRRMLVPWAISTAAAAAALAPFALLVASERGQLPDTPALGVHTVGDVLVWQWFGSSIVLAVVAWPLVALGLSRTRSVIRLLLPALVIPTGVLLAGALVNPELYQPRYLAVCAPFVALGMAAGISAIPWPLVRVVALVTALSFSVPALVSQRAIDAKKDTAWSAVAQVIADARDGSRTAIVYGALSPHHGATARVISVAYPAAFAGTTDVTLDIAAADYPDDLWGTWLPLDRSLDRLAGAQTAFLITTAALDRDGSDDEVLRATGWIPEAHWREGDITIVRYER
jgi:mannosyltransferase